MKNGFPTHAKKITLKLKYTLKIKDEE